MNGVQTVNITFALRKPSVQLLCQGISILNYHKCFRLFGYLNYSQSGGGESVGVSGGSVFDVVVVDTVRCMSNSMN